jgi:hypothetical protein
MVGGFPEATPVFAIIFELKLAYLFHGDFPLEYPVN